MSCRHQPSRCYFKVISVGRETRLGPAPEPTTITSIVRNQSTRVSQLVPYDAFDRRNSSTLLFHQTADRVTFLSPLARLARNIVETTYIALDARTNQKAAKANQRFSRLRSCHSSGRIATSPHEDDGTEIEVCCQVHACLSPPQQS